jgi:WXG100 family type VII secretion target
MSGQIRMSPAELADKAKRYGRSGDQIDQILKDLTILQSDLQSQWEGKAFTQFQAQFDELSPKVQNFAHLMREIEGQLTKTADAVARQDEELSRNFGLR